MYNLAIHNLLLIRALSSPINCCKSQTRVAGEEAERRKMSPACLDVCLDFFLFFCQPLKEYLEDLWVEKGSIIQLGVSIYIISGFNKWVYFLRGSLQQTRSLFCEEAERLWKENVAMWVEEKSCLYWASELMQNGKWWIICNAFEVYDEE